MTVQFSVYCGLDTNGHDEVDARQTVLDLALKYFPDGHSISEHTGRWARRDSYGPTSDVITEQTLVVDWIYSPVSTMSLAHARNLVSRFAGAYKEACFQESVLLVEMPIDATLL